MLEDYAYITIGTLAFVHIVNLSVPRGDKVQGWIISLCAVIWPIYWTIVADKVWEEIFEKEGK